MLAEQRHILTEAEKSKLQEIIHSYGIYPAAVQTLPFEVGTTRFLLHRLIHPHNPQEYNYYLTNQDTHFQKGSEGKIYYATWLDPEEEFMPGLLPDKDLVLKVMSSHANKIKGAETSDLLMSKFPLEVVPSFIYGTRIFSFMKLMNGGDLFHDYRPETGDFIGLPPEITSLSLSKKLAATVSFASNLMFLHHYRKGKWGEVAPYIHGDLKHDNLMQLITASAGQEEIREIFPLDLARAMPVEDATTLIPADFLSVGNWTEAAPESIQNWPSHKAELRSDNEKDQQLVLGVRGLKTDVFYACLILLQFLGVKNPCAGFKPWTREETVTTRKKGKETILILNGQILKENQQHESTYGLNFEGLLLGNEDISITGSVVSIVDLVKKFVLHARDVDYETRADSEEFLAFSTSLHKLYYAYNLDQATSDTTSAAVLSSLAKLILISSGFWHQTVNGCPLKNRVFTDKEALCTDILQLHQSQQLNFGALTEALQKYEPIAPPPPLLEEKSKPNSIAATLTRDNQKLSMELEQIQAAYLKNANSVWFSAKHGEDEKQAALILFRTLKYQIQCDDSYQALQKTISDYLAPRKNQASAHSFDAYFTAFFEQLDRYEQGLETISGKIDPTKMIEKYSYTCGTFGILFKEKDAIIQSRIATALQLQKPELAKTAFVFGVQAQKGRELAHELPAGFSRT